MANLLHHTEHRQAIDFDRLAYGHVCIEGDLGRLVTNIFEGLQFGDGPPLVFDPGQGQHGHLERATTPLVAALAGAPVGKNVIDPNDSGNLVVGVADLTRLANLVEHGSGVLESDVDRPYRGRGAALVRADEVDGLEPLDQRRAGAMHDGSCGKRGLKLAVNALVQHAFFEEVGLGAAAVGTAVALGPSQLKEALAAGLLGAEAALEGQGVHLAAGLGPVKAPQLA